MSSIVQRIAQKNLGHPPRWLPANMAYETIMGSVAYGVSSDTSDCDIYGFAIPQKDDAFPHLRGDIPGFGRQHQKFGQWQEHHIEDKEARKVYDCSIYSIVKYFNLCMENNPNMIDSIFTPRRCVLYSTPIGEMVRDQRRIFLHKKSWHTFKGYAYAQLKKIDNGANRANPKRQESIDKYGYDVKFGYHVVRLILQVEQIMVEHDLDLERNSEQLKAIRRGEWSLEKLKEWFSRKEYDLETVYATSTLPHGPDEAAIKKLLLQCLEHHYGSLTEAVKTDHDVPALVRELDEILARYR